MKVMILKKWEDIPEWIKNEETKKYYNILEKKKVHLFLKRLLDILMSIILLIILSPVFLIVAALIKIDSKGKVFYRQERITQYGRKFKILKFRTMVENADKMGELVTVEGDSRITRVGKKIRKYRIDEIPQLINILMGDMSFVGTRPEVEKFVNLYTDRMKATLLMPAGVTSKASIKFKDEDEIISKYLSNEEKLDLIYKEKILPEKMKWNLDYMEKFTITEDLKTDIMTLMNVIK